MSLIVTTESRCDFCKGTIHKQSTVYYSTEKFDPEYRRHPTWSALKIGPVHMDLCGKCSPSIQDYFKERCDESFKGYPLGDE